MAENASNRVGFRVLRALLRLADGILQGRRWNVTRSILRVVLTILMYAGVVVFLFPYFTGRIMSGIPFMIIGAGCTVVCGLLRCYLTEGDCAKIPHHSRDW